MTNVHDDVTTPDHDEPEATNSRRTALRALALGGAGAAVGVLASGKPAAADDPNDVTLGSFKTSTAPTGIDYEGADIAATDTGPSIFSSGGYEPDGTAPFPAGVGGYGDSKVPNGVHGSTTNRDGFGVVAANLAPAPTTSAETSPRGLAVASANGAQVLFLALDGAVVGPTPGAHIAGELYRDADGTLWYTVLNENPANETDVRFVKLAGTPAAGSYHAITPSRAYDSRQTGGAYAETGVLDPLASRIVSVADAHDAGGTVTTADVVPAGATAVHVNLTAANGTDGNYLSLEPGDATGTPVTSAVNWDAGVQQIANALTVRLDADRQLRVTCGDQAGSVHVIVDVFGYYL